MKFIYTLLIAFLLTGCETTTETPAVNQSSPQTANTMVFDCWSNPYIMGLKSMRQFDTMQVWLEHNGDVICDEQLYSCMAQYHIISQLEYDTAVGIHLDNHPTLMDYPLTWGAIDTFIANNEIYCYDKYIGFTFTSGIMSLKILSFTNTETCYSVPMLRGIREIHGLTATDNLVFTKGMMVIPGSSPSAYREVVLIKVTTTTGTAYYDITDDPR